MEYCDVIFRKILLNHHVFMNDVILTSINTGETEGWRMGGTRKGKKEWSGTWEREVQWWDLDKDRAFSWGTIGILCILVIIS